MPDQNNDTLEAVLLRKAASIGRPTVPQPTLSMMPLPPTAKVFGAVSKISPFEIAKKIDSMGGWARDMIDPGSMMLSKNPMMNLGQELARLVMGRQARELVHDGRKVVDWMTEGTPFQTGSVSRP